jgi:cell division septum initiation protein DivIVA
MDQSTWIALAAVGISAITVIANQIRIRRVERGEYVDTVQNQIQVLREELRDIRDKNKDLERRLRECERERILLTQQSLELSLKVKDLLENSS